MSKLPILYSFRRCPYAIRARMALKVSGIRVELREVSLADKPEHMILCSPKGTVPVLLPARDQLIEESMEIMLWALGQSDPAHWLPDDKVELQVCYKLIELNDNEFKPLLDGYKYSGPLSEKSMERYRDDAEKFLHHLESRLTKAEYLVNNKISFADVALLPFIRQFSMVDQNWFYQTEYTRLKKWMETLLKSHLFVECMKTYPIWKEGNDMTYL